MSLITLETTTGNKEQPSCDYHSLVGLTTDADDQMVTVLEPQRAGFAKTQPAAGVPGQPPNVTLIGPAPLAATGLDAVENLHRHC
jgi:hypothetical protein